MCSLMANAQIKKPELMVFPSDEWCIRNGYFTEVDNMGTTTRIPNYKQALQEDMGLRLPQESPPVEEIYIHRSVSEARLMKNGDIRSKCSMR